MLRHDEKGEEKLVRVKGASRMTHEHFGPEDFGQEGDRPLYANRYRLGPTPGHDIQITFESRRVIAALNAKRRCEVSARPDFTSEGDALLFLSLAPRIQFTPFRSEGEGKGRVRHGVAAAKAVSGGRGREKS